MTMTNRHWLPQYCDPQSFIPRITETRVLFDRPPYYFPDFVGRAIAFLQSDETAKMGFKYDERQILPCTWKCADESMFHVPMSLLAYTGVNRFQKGMIGGRFNEGSVKAAVHHGSVNLDFGGSHVGYIPGDSGGTFGYIWRPQKKEFTSNCGHLTNVITPFVSVYQEACRSILLYRPNGEDVIASIPNEYLQPNWSSHTIKVLVDLDTFCAGVVDYKVETPHTKTSVARSLFRVAPEFFSELSSSDASMFLGEKPTPIGKYLKPKFFNIFDTNAELDQNGLPLERLQIYMKYIVGAQHSPSPLKAAIVSTNLEHNRLLDTIRSVEYQDYSFACFSGIFVDICDMDVGNYYNLFQPIALALKPASSMEVVEMTTEEMHDRFEKLAPVDPKLPLLDYAGFADAKTLVDRFTFRPGRFKTPDSEVLNNLAPFDET